MLCDGLSRAAAHERPRLCRLVSELYQLTGEVFFDADRYVDAAQCYVLASTAAQEAKAHDLWAAAMTRHAFVSIFGQQPDKAMPMLDLAAARSELKPLMRDPHIRRVNHEIGELGRSLNSTGIR